MTEESVPTDERGVRYGFGLYIHTLPRGGLAWSHTGAGQGSGAFYACLPERRFAVAVVVNAPGYRTWSVVRQAALDAFVA